MVPINIELLLSSLTVILEYCRKKTYGVKYYSKETSLSWPKHPDWNSWVWPPFWPFTSTPFFLLQYPINNDLLLSEVLYIEFLVSKITENIENTQRLSPSQIDPRWQNLREETNIGLSPTSLFSCSNSHLLSSDSHSTHLVDGPPTRRERVLRRSHEGER